MSTDLHPGHIDISSDVPDLLGDYELVDMAEKLWCYEYPNSIYYGRYYNGRPYKCAARDINHMASLITKGGWTDQTIGKFSGEYVTRPLSVLLDGEADGVAVYSSPTAYTLVKRDAGERE